VLDLPVIDLSDRHHGATARRALAGHLDAACRDLGFFVVTGHGVDPQLPAAAFEAARAFFDRPLETKLACEHPWPNVSRGYRRLGGEAQAYANGGDTPADLSETFGVGVEPIPDDAYHREGAAYFPPNVWPAGGDDMRSALLAYRDACQELAVDLMRLAALALGIDEEFFTGKVDAPIGSLRCNSYPALDEPPLPGQFRGGAHTDYGTLTVLATDGRPGLEVRPPDGGWIPVEPVEGGFIINVGDLLSRWTNGRWRSAWHRVVVPRGPGPHPARLSIVYFQFPNWDVRVEAVASCLAPGQQAPEPVLAGEFLHAKFARLYAVAD
jgi:isopenicillin N synthase-like dioxygenase